MNRLQQFWFNQAVAEYTSSARTVELCHWMQQLSISPDLIRDAIRIADDEMVHAQICFDVSQAVGCTKKLPIESMRLHLEREFESHAKSLLLVIVQSYCFGETVAVPLFSAMRKSASEPAVITVFDRILEDEPRHAKFGWLTLAWCYENLPQTKQWLPQIVPIALSRMRVAYQNHPPFAPALSEQELAWGIFPRELYGDILEKTIQKTFNQRLVHYGINLN
ncbi:MAG: ferritin-like domain-containing protein [Oceanospirillaceae bacterium]|nr:ferritin-like domain-containing protein [Oceanospirillaceae bacterium]